MEPFLEVAALGVPARRELDQRGGVAAARPCRVSAVLDADRHRVARARRQAIESVQPRQACLPDLGLEGLARPQRVDGLSSHPTHVSARLEGAFKRLEDSPDERDVRRRHSRRRGRREELWDVEAAVVRDACHAHSPSRVLVRIGLRAPARNRVHDAVEVPHGVAREPGRPRNDDGTVELVRKAQHVRVVAVQAQLVVRDPRWFVQVRVESSEEPPPRQPPVRRSGVGEQVRQLLEQTTTRHLVVVDVQDPASAALRMQPGDERVTGIPMREKDDLVRDRAQQVSVLRRAIVERDDDLGRERSQEGEHVRES